MRLMAGKIQILSQIFNDKKDIFGSFAYEFELLQK